MSYTLPPLPYSPNALEPYFDARTMEIHHGKHHQAYVDYLNKAIAGTPHENKSIEQLVKEAGSISPAVRNNGGGHWNHTFFWNTLAPAANSGAPSPELLKAIEASFGSMDDFKKAFNETATKRFGSGWAWLISAKGKLRITSTANQDNPLMKGIVPDVDLGTPLLGLDVWEHAYYLHYQNRRADYINAWWSVINWGEVSRKFAAL